ncbi:TM2 domain-containing protein [Campylobacter sp. RM9332]|nr:TM2 domain-containing protein [Campylobacter sp. RM9332]
MIVDTAQKLFLNNKIKDINLLSLEDKQIDINKLSEIKLKEPKIGLILGIFFGILGADRFYKGDGFLGFIKFILFFISHFCLLFVLHIPLAMLFYSGPDAPPPPFILQSKIYLNIVAFSFILIWFIFIIWVILDWFLVYRGIKKDNLQKILSVIKEEN